MTNAGWETMTDDELLDRLGTALAPAGPEATAADPVVVPLVIAAPHPSPSAWRRPLAWAAAILVIAGVAVGIAARDDGADGVKTIDPAVPGTVSRDPDLRAAQLAMAALEAALATGEPTTIAPADETLRAALALLDPDERASLGSRPDQLLAAANDALTFDTTTPTTTGTTPTTTTSVTSAGPASDPTTTTTTAGSGTPTAPTTPTTVDDHGGGDGIDNSGPGSSSSGPGSSGTGSSGSDSLLSGSDDGSHG